MNTIGLTPRTTRKHFYRSPRESRDDILHFIARQARTGSCKSDVRKDNQECNTEDTDHFDGEKEELLPAYMPNYAVLLGSTIQFCTYILCLFDPPHVFSVPSCPRRETSTSDELLLRSGLVAVIVLLVIDPRDQVPRCVGIFAKHLPNCPWYSVMSANDRNFRFSSRMIITIQERPQGLSCAANRDQTTWGIPEIHPQSN